MSKLFKELDQKKSAFSAASRWPFRKLGQVRFHNAMTESPFTPWVYRATRGRHRGGGMTGTAAVSSTTPPLRTPCPLCNDSSAVNFCSVDGRTYWRCRVCQARFLAPEDRLSPAEEYAHYLHHENDPDDPAYRRFLSKLAEPLLERLAPASRGLDYGCGPGPALAAMLREAGHSMALFDPFFAPDAAPLAARYDFVTCTETAEHFHDPQAEFARLRALVRPGGWLAVMTCFQTDDSHFATWHYRRDPTHVLFYREATFRFLAAGWGWRCEVPHKDVALMQRPLTAACA